MSNQLLKFSKGNSKIPKSTLIFSLPAGHSCPGAKDCKASVLERENGTRFIVDGEHTKFRCYAASSEVQYPDVHNLRKRNFELIKNARSVEAKVELIQRSMLSVGLKNIDTVRVHESGDYFLYSYFQAWMIIAQRFPTLKFYSYTKSLPFFLRGASEGIIPENFIFTASFGGKFDDSIATHNLKNVKVVTTKEEVEQAVKEGRQFDHDDSHALIAGESFALMVHGTQPKGSKAAKTWDKLVKSGVGGYSKKKKAALPKSVNNEIQIAA
jgi:hypothetical protein